MHISPSYAQQMPFCISPCLRFPSSLGGSCHECIKQAKTPCCERIVTEGMRRRKVHLPENWKDLTPSSIFALTLRHRSFSVSSAARPGEIMAPYPSHLPCIFTTHTMINAAVCCRTSPITNLPSPLPWKSIYRLRYATTICPNATKPPPVQSSTGT